MNATNQDAPYALREHELLCCSVHSLRNKLAPEDFSGSILQFGHLVRGETDSAGEPCVASDAVEVLPSMLLQLFLPRMSLTHSDLLSAVSLH